MFSLCFGKKKKAKSTSAGSDRAVPTGMHHETKDISMAPTKSQSTATQQRPAMPTSPSRGTVHNSPVPGHSAAAPAPIAAAQTHSDTTNNHSATGAATNGAPVVTSPMRQQQMANLDEGLLATVIDKIYEYCLADDRVRHYFRSADRKRLSNMQLKFLKHAVAGSPYNVSGMRQAHRRMVDLKDYHFDAILENWRKAFIDCGVPDDYTELILAVAEQSRDDILGRS
ncbi:hypothetical protein IWQ60_002855 [Tieghemiomyces parasiticus]|uniref:Globin n=1 Tax=Tieghemiomyces parasiticus TaxID=78921 RepID=A0A9W8DX03_9FUNG|nr:hypothetical protein IWQ60_002855 [Tieghemiomyces parasiticus]